MANESNRIEYKQELSDSLEKEAIAFLNSTEGGTILFGVTDEGRPIGLNSPDDIQLKIKDRLKNNILPSCIGLFDLILTEMEGKEVLKLSLASGPEKPYYLRKYGMTERGCFIRLGSSSNPMPIDMIENTFSKRTRNSIGKMRSPRQELTFEQLHIFYQAKGLELTDKFAANLSLQTEDKAYNYAAYLLADENGNSVQVAKYRGLDRYDLISSNEYGYCSLIKSCKQVLDRLDVENITSTKITSKERLEQRRWNAVAVREAVINAIIHNDYTNGAVPKFEIFDDRLEITSAGSIAPGIAQEEFFEGYSNPRNPILMRIFKDLEFVEYLGSGMPRILKAYSKDSFKFTTNFIRLVLPIKNQLQALPQPSDISATEYKFSDRQKEILSLISQNPKISRPDLSKALGLAESTIQRYINTLHESGVIKRINGNRGYWEVLHQKFYNPNDQQ